MNKSGKPAQMALNTLGFAFIVLGMAADGGLSFILLGLAAAMFVSALIVAVAFGAGRPDA